jgi:hypothetical protein
VFFGGFVIRYWKMLDESEGEKRPIAVVRDIESRKSVGVVDVELVKGDRPENDVLIFFIDRPSDEMSVGLKLELIDVVEQMAVDNNLSVENVQINAPMGPEPSE